MQHEGYAGHRIVDDHKRFRLFRSCKRTKPCKRDFLADASLAVTENVGLRLPRDVIAVRESLCGFGNSDGAKRRAGHHFSPVHAAKAKQLHAIAEGRRRKVACGTSLHHEAGEGAPVALPWFPRRAPVNTRRSSSGLSCDSFFSSPLLRPAKYLC